MTATILAVGTKPSPASQHEAAVNDAGGGGSRKNIWEAWPLIIWEATAAKRNYFITNYINQTDQ